MRKHAVLFTLALLEMTGLMLSGFFWFVMRKDLLATYATSAVPFSTKLALSSWFVPASGVLGAAMFVLAMLPVVRQRTRVYLCGTALVWTVFTLFFAIWASYAPAFEHLARLPQIPAIRSITRVRSCS